MNAALVKIDVAAADLGVGVRRIEAMVDGGDLVTSPLLWVFNLSTDLRNSSRRELRFWRPELAAHAAGEPEKFAQQELLWVIRRILLEKRTSYHAGEVDQMFQIRHNTRLEMHAELCGSMASGRSFYPRQALVSFLQRRWLSGTPNLSPRAAATPNADTNKQTTHAATLSV